MADELMSKKDSTSVVWHSQMFLKAELSVNFVGQGSAICLAILKENI